MKDSIRVQRRAIIPLIALILVLGIFQDVILETNGYHSKISASTIQAYQAASTNALYQGEHLNISTSIKNIYFEDLLNVTLKAKIPSEMQFLSSTVPDLEVENDSEDFSYNFGSLPVDKSFNLTVTYNVTSSETKTITLEPMNISFQFIGSGIEASQPTNSIEEILLKGEKIVTNTETSIPLPSATISAHPIFSILGYFIPISTFGVSIIVLRRFRR